MQVPEHCNNHSFLQVQKPREEGVEMRQSSSAQGKSTTSIKCLPRHARWLQSESGGIVTFPKLHNVTRETAVTS
jgi:hypothetical protein